MAKFSGQISLSGQEKVAFLIDLLLEPVDGEDNVLEDLLGEGHGPDDGGGGELHEGGLGRQHPAQQEQEQRVIAEGDHRLDHPEDGLQQQMCVTRILFQLKKRISP
jgi:hypothetical protein